MKTKFVAKSSTSKLFVGKNNDLVQSPNDAVKFDSIGECMRACVEANDNLGKYAFKVCEISE